MVNYSLGKNYKKLLLWLVGTNWSYVQLWRSMKHWCFIHMPVRNKIIEYHCVHKLKTIKSESFQSDSTMWRIQTRDKLPNNSKWHARTEARAGRRSHQQAISKCTVRWQWHSWFSGSLIQHQHSSFRNRIYSHIHCKWLMNWMHIWLVIINVLIEVG